MMNQVKHENKSTRLTNVANSADCELTEAMITQLQINPRQSSQSSSGSASLAPRISPREQDTVDQAEEEVSRISSPSTNSSSNTTLSDASSIKVASDSSISDQSSEAKSSSNLTSLSPSSSSSSSSNLMSSSSIASSLSMQQQQQQQNQHHRKQQQQQEEEDDDEGHTSNGSDYTIFVGDLSRYFSEEDLFRLFCKHGHVTDAVIKKSKRDGISLGYGFVKMSNYDEAANAIKSLNGVIIKGRPLKTRWGMRKAEIKDYSTPKKISINSIFVRFRTLRSNVLVTEEILSTIFNKYGEVLDVNVKSSVENHMNGLHVGYAFVHYHDNLHGIKCACDCVEDLMDVYMGNVHLQCALSRHLTSLFTDTELNCHPEELDMLKLRVEKLHQMSLATQPIGNGSGHGGGNRMNSNGYQPGLGGMGNSPNGMPYLAIDPQYHHPHSPPISPTIPIMTQYGPQYPIYNYGYQYLPAGYPYSPTSPGAYVQYIQAPIPQAPIPHAAVNQRIRHDQSSHGSRGFHHSQYH